MYNHMKIKHAVDPQGSYQSNSAPANPSSGSRGRGRPRRAMDFERVDPTSETFLKADSRAGGPTETIEGFLLRAFHRRASRSIREIISSIRCGKH